MIAFLMSKLGKMISSALAVLALVGAIWLGGRKDAQKDRKIDDLEDFVKRQEDVNEVQINTDRDAALERLRDNNQLRD